MHIKFFSIEYTKLNDIIKSNHKINIRRDLIMSFYKKMVSVCAAVALSTSINSGHTGFCGYRYDTFMKQNVNIPVDGLMLCKTALHPAAM